MELALRYAMCSGLYDGDNHPRIKTRLYHHTMLLPGSLINLGKTQGSVNIGDFKMYVSDLGGLRGLVCGRHRTGVWFSRSVMSHEL